MVLPAFLAAKLGALLFSQVAKPLATRAKKRAKTSAFFRNYICMPPAQFYHFCEVRMTMWSTQMGKPVKIPKMTEASAIELGAELVGELVIFSVAAAVLIAEVVRSSRINREKEEARKERLLRIHSELKELYFAKAELEAEVTELRRIFKVNVSLSEEALLSSGSIPIHHRNTNNTDSSSSSSSISIDKSRTDEVQKEEEGKADTNKAGFFSSITSYYYSWKSKREE